MSKGFFSKTNEARRAGRKVTNPTNQDLILKETFKKEIKHVKLYTQFSPDYVKMGIVLAFLFLVLNRHITTYFFKLANKCICASGDIVTRKITERDEERFADQEFELGRIYADINNTMISTSDISTHKSCFISTFHFNSNSERSDTDERRSKRNLSTTSGEYGSFTGPLVRVFTSTANPVV